MHHAVMFIVVMGCFFQVIDELLDDLVNRLGA